MNMNLFPGKWAKKNDGWPSRHSKRKFERGDNCCGNCGSCKHDSCRPKLDGTLCSCSCVRASMLRDEYERKINIAIACGKPKPSLNEALEMLIPRYKQVFSTGLSK